MSDREKLIELLAMTTVEQVFCTSSGEVVSRYWCRAVADEDVARVADHLIANGVTVRKRGRWVSVDESLPELIPCNAGTAYSEAVIAWTTGRKAMIAVWDGIDWLRLADFWEAWGDEVTHWMPLPEPPKEGGSGWMS